MSAKFTGKCCTCGYKIDVGAWIIKRPVKPLPFRHGDISESLFGAGAQGVPFAHSDVQFSIDLLDSECRKADSSADKYPGARGNSGLWRRCKTPKSMTCAQSPTKQESSFVRMRSPCPSGMGRCHVRSICKTCKASDMS